MINKNYLNQQNEIICGYATVLSRPIFTDPKNFFKVNALTTFVNTIDSNSLFFSDYYDLKNRLHNRMKFLSEPKINIINILEKNVDNNERFIALPVHYKRDGNWIDKNQSVLNREYWEGIPDEQKPPVFNINVYNLTFEEFFDLETVYYMLKDEPNNTIFFFEANTWSKVIHFFNMTGISISGGSTNQRHLFNSLDYTLSILLTTLFGKNFAQKSTNFMYYKNIDKKIFKPNFNYNSKYAIYFREFNSLISNGKIQSFATISKSIFTKNVILPSAILPWDLIKVWFKIIGKVSDKEAILLEILMYIFTELKNNKSEEEIISYVIDKYEILRSGLDEDGFIYTEFNKLNQGKEDEITRDDFFWKRFNPKSENYYSYNKNIIIKNPNFIQKREFHTSYIRYSLNKNIKSKDDDKDNIKNNYTKLTKVTNSLILDNIKLSKFSSNIKEILSDNNIDTRTKQLNLENRLFNFYENINSSEFNMKKLKGKISFKDKLILGYSERLNILYSNKTLEKKFGKFSLLLNDTKWLYLTSSILSISNNKGYNNICINLADNIMYNIYLDIKNIDLDKSSHLHKNQFVSKVLFKKPTKVYQVIDLFSHSNIERWKNINYIEWRDELEIDFKFTISLGDLFITFFTDILTNDCPIYFRVPGENRYNDPYIIKFNLNLDNDIINEFIDIPSNTLPMVHLPDEWKEGQIGGFLNDKFKNTNLITDPKKGSNSHKITNLNKAYDVVNKLNSIKFKINDLFLNYLENEGKWLLEIIQLKNSNDVRIYNQLTLQLAKAFSGNTLYFSHFLDWRGRIYNSSYFLNYQGDDLRSSLIVFNDGYKLSETGKYYLYIALANSHNENNISKQSFIKRYNWVIDNYNKIINLDKEFILKADKTFNFLSLALSLREYNLNPNFIFNNPIFLDATCSGIQHVAALIRDFELATLTNLNKSKDTETPEDFYNDCIQKVNKEINDYGEKYLDYSNLKNVKLNRKLAKESIMTVVYNVSIYGMKEQLSNKTKTYIHNNETISGIMDLRDKNMYTLFEQKYKIKKRGFTLFEFPSHNENETVLLNGKDVFMISKILNNFIFKEYKGLGKVYFFITELAKITNLLNLPIIWKAPNGLEFYQYYNKSEKSNINLRLFGIVKEIHYLNYHKELNKQKQKNAIIPNIIHTLDSSHLYNIILESNNIHKNVISIHDCFGSHANDMAEIHHIVRKTFLLQYLDFDFLKEFRNKIINLIKINDYTIKEVNNETILFFNNKEYVIPNVPELGNFDIQQIENSKYIIC